MAKRKRQKKDDFPIGNISAEGYVARVATGNGRRKNKSKNLFG
jgi:hypothetical protein